MLTPMLGTQRESDAQRRVDQAIRFAVWARARGGFPSAVDIQAEFGCSRRTAGRWRKALALALGAKPPGPGAPPAVPLATSRTPSAEIARELVRCAPMLSLSRAVVARDVSKRFGCSYNTARLALGRAMTHLKQQGIPVERSQ